ncbi:MAG: DUF6503 family protein [Bacteroidota bacterium]
MKNLLLFVLLVALVAACAPPQAKEENPAAEGFNAAGSDASAIALADSIMKAMGGRKAWDDTRFISWNFFGRRNLTWDKHTGRVRVDALRDTIVYLVNVNTGEGRVRVKGQEVTEIDSLTKMLKRAKSIWINDSYWLVMPFKLKDSGVTLKDLGTDTLMGENYRILQLTFVDVGDTPNNKYKLYVDPKDNLIKHWAFFSSAKRDTATFIRPWDNYQMHGGVLLSGNRSDSSGPRDVKVYQTLPDSVFTQF